MHGYKTDVILLDPSIAIHEKIDEQLWTGCFYKEFQEIKKRIATVKLIFFDLPYGPMLTLDLATEPG